MYNLACTQSAPQEDRRSKLEQALEELADKISDTPTLPYDQRAEAQRADLAVELPTKHCAFENCSWSHRCVVNKCPDARDVFLQKADQQLIDHLILEHEDSLHFVADELSHASRESERVCFASACNQ